MFLLGTAPLRRTDCRFFHLEAISSNVKLQQYQPSTSAESNVEAETCICQVRTTSFTQERIEMELKDNFVFFCFLYTSLS